jgi:transcriptional regulator with XRE-family HTH domain
MSLSSPLTDSGWIALRRITSKKPHSYDKRSFVNTTFYVVSMSSTRREAAAYRYRCAGMTRKEPATIYGRRLREARDSYGFSQPELGVAIGLDMGGAGGRVSRYETGKHEVKLGLQKLFAKALALPLNYFYIEDDEEARLIAEASRSDKPVKLQKAVERKIKGK